MADDAASYGSRENLRRRQPRGSGDTSRSTDGMYRPGQPIGFLAARGTTYEKKYLTKKLGFCCKVIAPLIVIPTLVIALVPVVWAIANHTLHVAQLHVMEANLTSITNTSFPLSLSAQVTKSGIFPATLYFRAPVDVYWNTPPPNMRELHLGTMKLGRVNAAAGHAKVLQTTQFDILDVEGFGEFSEYLISQPEFTWYLRCPNVHAEAFGFLPAFKNYDFRKHVVFNGFDNFHNVKILDFQLPGDDPQGGITAQVLTSLTNPSAFSVQLGNLNLDLYYKDLYLGPARTSGPVNVTSGVNTVLLLSRLIPHADNQTALDMLGEVFTGYINGDAVPVVAAGVSTTLANGDTIGWLSRGIQALRVQVPLQSPEPIEPIKGITIDYLSLIYDEQQPWAPTTYSNALTGQIALPFGFSLDIISTSNSIDLQYANQTVAMIDGAFSNTTTKLNLVSAGQTAGQLDLTLPPTRLSLPGNGDTAHNNFINFEKALIFSNDAKVQLQGSAKALTDTPVGRVLLNGIKFNVGSGLTGLDSLTRYPTEITGVDVVGGTTDNIQLIVGTALVNPSNLNLTTGDSRFQLSNEVVVGDVTLPNLNLKIGRNDINATSNFNPNVHPKGIETLNRFISGLDTNLNITGYDNSSSIVSLNPAFLPMKLNATLPGLQRTLVQAANLTVLDTTGVTNNIANSVVELANPFTAGLTITNIKSTVYSNGIFLAQIDTPLNFPAAGKAVTASPTIPLGLNLYPPDIFGALRAFAVNAGMNPAYVDGIVALGGFTLTPSSGTNMGNQSGINMKRDVEQEEQLDTRANEGGALADVFMGVGNNDPRSMQELEDSVKSRGVERLQKRANLYTGFDLPSYVAQAFKSAMTDLIITSDAVIGEYGTTLTFSQHNVPLNTDDTLFKLLPVLAKPIVQKIVDASILNIDTATVLNPQQTSFGTALKGSLTQAGPFDAIVEFPAGLNVMYLDRLLGQLAMPNITLVGDVGSTLDLQSDFKVSDTGFMQTFATDLLHNPTFVWNIQGEGLAVHALGISVQNLTIGKEVILTGFNGLQGDVIINSFDLPSNDAAGGIHLTVDATINSRSQVGVQLSRFGTNIMGNGTMLGPSAAANEFTLQALAQTPVPLVGRLIQQNSQDGLNVLSNVFTRFVHDQNTEVSVVGQFAGPDSVTWLNNAIQTLTIAVSLPAQKFQVIKYISLNQLSLAFTQPTQWSPATSTVNTTAPFFLPFAFPIDITTATGGFIANYNGQDAAILNVPTVPAITDVTARILTLAFNDVPFQVYDNAHGTFSQFLADTTAKDQVTFNLHGVTTAAVSTAAGAVTITDIPFDVDSSILGLQNFNARPAVVSNLDVARGYPDYLMITLDTALYNPSDITITTGTVNFNTMYTNRLIGEALINDLTVTPGTNNLPTTLRYSPQGADNVRAGQTVLENYVQNITSAAVVQGTTGSTPIASLQQALSGVALNTNIPPLMKLIITEAILQVPKNIAQDGGVASTEVVVANPFTASLNIIKVQASAIYNDLTIGTINDDLTNNPIRAPGHQSTTSQAIPITLDIRPKSLVQLVLELSAATGVSLGPWPPFFQEILNLPGDAATQVSPYPDSSDTGCHLGNQFDLLGAVLQALKGLAVRIPIQSQVLIDEYFTNLDFTQNPVPVQTDDTALYLLGPAGAPLIQLIVDQAALSFSQANATQLTDNGFYTTLRGKLLTDAPANALIEFTQPIQIAWQGSNIAEISLPPICTIPGQGVPDLETAGQLRITNLGRFTDFATYILHNPSFTWTISSDAVIVRALGIVFSKVNLNKQISLDVFNNLPGVTISGFDIPSEGPDYLNFVTDSMIPSPSALGVELGTAIFHVFFKGTYLGPASAYDLFLLPKAVTSTKLYGQLISHSGDSGALNNVGILFSQFLQGKNSTLQVTGYEVISPAQPNSPVNWLSTAFKTLTLDVILQGHIYEIIFSITISDLTVLLLGNAATESYNVPATNQHTLAKYSNPFHFTLAPVSAAPMIIINYQGVDTAEIDLPNNPVQAQPSTGPETQSDLVLMFRNQTIHSLNDGSFNAFFAQLTDKTSAAFGLHGGTDVTADTHIGRITITGIPFNVSTSLEGINSFDGNTPVSNVSVVGSTPQYIKIPLTVGLYNPSNLTIYTRDIYIPAQYMGYEIGRAYIAELSLLPGNNSQQAEFRFAPPSITNANALRVLELYLEPANKGEGGGTTPQNAPLTIGGNPQTSQAITPYGSLLDALEGVHATSVLPGIGARLVTQIDVKIDILTALATNMGTADITFMNALPTQLTINRLTTNISVSGRESEGTRATVDYTIPGGTTIPNAPGTAKTSNVPFTLTRGTLNSLDVIGNDLSTDNIVDTTIQGGYNVPTLPYSLYTIRTTYTILLLGIPFNITDPAKILQGIISQLGLGGLVGIEGQLAQIPQNVLGNISQGLDLNNGLTQSACTALPVLGNLLPCQTVKSSMSAASASTASTSTATTGSANTTTASTSATTTASNSAGAAAANAQQQTSSTTAAAQGAAAALGSAAGAALGSNSTSA